jgi:hypothetical protein
MMTTNALIEQVDAAITAQHYEQLERFLADYAHEAECWQLCWYGDASTYVLIPKSEYERRDNFPLEEAKERWPFLTLELK